MPTPNGGATIGSAVRTLTELAKALDADPAVQWHREHDKLHHLYKQTRPFVDPDAEDDEPDWRTVGGPQDGLQGLDPT
jgi:hypothetical protein